LPDEMLGGGSVGNSGTGETKVYSVPTSTVLPASTSVTTKYVPEAAQVTETEQPLPQAVPAVEQSQVLSTDNHDLNNSLAAPAAVNAVRLVEVPAAAVTAPVVPIYYDPSFVDEEKPDFEKDILAGLMGGKELSMISITKGADRVVTVELYLKDGTIENKLFLRNAKIGIWNEVKYVQRYFFDDSLRYEVSYPFRMDTVNPFQYSNLNR